MNNLPSSGEDLARATRARLDSVYEYLVDDEDARVCTDIDERACREVPRNFFLMLLANVFTKLGGELSNPKTVLAWLFNFAGAPLSLVGFLVPIRESGSLIPQLLFAAPVRALARRKWAWVTGSLGQALAVMGIGGVALSLQGWIAGIAILALLTVFSPCRGLCSIAHKDVVGKTIPKTRRGRLSGWSGTMAGLLGLAVGVYLALGLAPDTAGFYGGLLLAAGGLWLLGAGCFALVDEQPGETGGGGNAIAEALKSLRLLRDDTAFRPFVLVRSLLLCSALTAPYYVAVSNTVIGMILLAAGSIGALAVVVPPEGIVLVLSLLGLGGAALGRYLPKVE